MKYKTEQIIKQLNMIAATNGTIFAQQNGASNEAIDIAISLIEDIQHWIPCSDRLPEGIGTYMTTLDYGKYGLAVGQRYYHGTLLGWEDNCVIAWMPLPEPYTADMKGDERE